MFNMMESQTVDTSISAFQSLLLQLYLYFKLAQSWCI